MIWRLLASVFGPLSIWHWIVALTFLLFAVTPPGLVVGAFFGANGKAATERATIDSDGWTTYLDASGAIMRRKFTSDGTTTFDDADGRTTDTVTINNAHLLKHSDTH